MLELPGYEERLGSKQRRPPSPMAAGGVAVLLGALGARRVDVFAVLRSVEGYVDVGRVVGAGAAVNRILVTVGRPDRVIGRAT